MVLFTQSTDGAVTVMATEGRSQAAWGVAGLEKGLHPGWWMHSCSWCPTGFYRCTHTSQVFDFILQTCVIYASYSLAELCKSITSS